MKSKYFILFLPLLLSCSNSGPKVDPIEYGDITIQNENYFHYFGRHTTSNNGVYLALSGCGMEVKVDVKEETNSFSIDVNSVLTSYNAQYISLEMDDERVDRISINSGSSSITLFENISLGEHHLRFIKDNETNFSRLTLKDVRFEGMDVLPIVEEYKNKKRIEVYGDSITCGYGVLGTTTESFSLQTEAASLSYGYLTSKKLDCDYSLVSASGISLAMNAFNSEYYFRHLYPTVDGNTSMDLSTYPLDIAVINLGTNDNTKFMTYDGNTQLQKVEEFYNAYVDLVTLIKERSPACRFVLCYNMMTSFNGYLVTALQGVTNYLNDNYGDCAYTLEFTPDYGGSDGHPGKTAHENNATILAEFIESLD